MVTAAGRRLIDGGTSCEDVRDQIWFGAILHNVGGEIPTERGGGSVSSNAAVAGKSMAEQGWDGAEANGR